jgi:hypothetical protein
VITISSHGSFENTEKFLKRMSDKSIFDSLSRYGEEGVQALAEATPKDSGDTARSWTYEIEKTSTSYAIIWSNTNVVDGVPIAVLIQVGHGTGTGGYVSGRDYINPALRPVFDRIAASVWKEVTAA